MDYDRYDALLHWIFRQTQGDAWFRPNEDNLSSGVALRISNNDFRIFPYDNPSLDNFHAAVTALNPLVAVKLRSAAVHAALANLPAFEKSISLDSQTLIQILDSILLLPHADRDQSAAFIRDERTLVIWSDSLDRIVSLCQDIDDRLIKLLWRSHHTPSLSNSLSNSINGSTDHSSTENSALAFNVPVKEIGPDSTSESHTRRSWFFKKPTLIDPEQNNLPDDERKNPRPVMLYAPVYNGLAAGLAAIFVGTGLKTLLVQWRLDGDFSRFALLSVMPLLYCVSLFFCIQIIQNLTMILGPIAHYHSNSKYFSSLPPSPDPEIDASLPHITIQMPVYKESLHTVLAPSIMSLKIAMQTYARQGGTSSIFVCDDGLRLIPRKDRDERLAFYATHNIGWVARPKDDGDPNTDQDTQVRFRRRGRFKKASNLNYGLELSLRMEKHLERLLKDKEKEPRLSSSSLSFSSATNLAQSHNIGIGLGLHPSSPLHSPIPLPLRRGRGSTTNTASTERMYQYTIQYQNRDADDDSTPPSSFPTSLLALSRTNSGILNPTPRVTPTPPPAVHDLEERSLNLAIEETLSLSSPNPNPSHRPWAANGRSLRIGDLLLLIDSDTVVPPDCLRDGAREMAHSPEVAIIQHESGVMSVAGHYFESGISYFTRRVNRCIGIACANGEVAPFMGHNAFLRWKALQDAAFVDPEDGKRKIWSENNVSEDFDMALRLILKGYTVRWATYSKGGFKEGVSLSVDDEINRWQKYSYGCNELLFNPLIQWFRKGPITKRIHTFLWSRAPLHYKFSMMAYMFSYYGIAASITISLINYILLGFQFPVDGYFMHSFEIFLATTVVFWWSGTAGYTLLEYRLGHKKLLEALLENLTWVPFFFFFFGGLSIPLTQSILAHLFSYDITWSATVKEVERSNFFKEIPKIAKRFWFPIGFSVLVILGMVICSMSFVPVEWRVDGGSWAVILPLSIATACHILFPIVLNPWLMVFSY